MTDRPQAPQTRCADAVLQTITVLYCVGSMMGVAGAVSGAFGHPGFFVLELLMCLGLFIWLMLLGFAIDDKPFSWRLFFVASFAILGTVLATLEYWYLGKSNI